MPEDRIKGDWSERIGSGRKIDKDGQVEMAEKL